MHSYAFRRLADKTQVAAPGEDDFPRTRLTHSLEVAQIGREMAEAVGADPDVVDAAGLAHDLGHPPFGHNGEQALDEVAAGIGGFEANAQTLRILTRLEVRTVDAGLNLTRAVLDATCKYPWQRRPGQRKFGVYADEVTAFDWIRAEAATGQRCVEAQLMDWADDVAYSVHDLEDAVHSGLLSLAGISSAERETLCQIAATDYVEMSADELSPVLDQLLELPPVRDLAAVGESYLAVAAAKRATSELTGRFVGAAVGATLRANPQGIRRYHGDLQVPARVVAECGLLKAITARYVMQRPAVGPVQAAQRQLLVELVGLLIEQGPDAVAPAARPNWEQADDGGRFRLIIDRVATFTDTTARAMHARLCPG